MTPPDTSQAPMRTSQYTLTTTNPSIATATIDLDRGQLTVKGLASGSVAVDVTATDLAGNTATQNFNFTFGAAPLDPPDLDADDDTGADNDDDSTSQISDLTFSGDNAEPNAAITITAARTTTPESVIVTTTTAGADRSYEADLNLSEGEWTVTVDQIAGECGSRHPKRWI